MTEQQADERRAWWAIQSVERDLAAHRHRMEPGHIAAVEKMLDYAREMHAQGLARMEVSR